MLYWQINDQRRAFFVYMRTNLVTQMATQISWLSSIPVSLWYNSPFSQIDVLKLKRSNVRLLVKTEWTINDYLKIETKLNAYWINGNIKPEFVTNFNPTINELPVSEKLVIVEDDRRSLYFCEYSFHFATTSLCGTSSQWHKFGCITQGTSYKSCPTDMPPACSWSRIMLEPMHLTLILNIISFHRNFRSRPFSGKTALVSSKNEMFQNTWTNVLKSAGCKVLHTPPSRAKGIGIKLKIFATRICKTKTQYRYMYTECH